MKITVSCTILLCGLLSLLSHAVAERGAAMPRRLTLAAPRIDLEPIVTTGLTNPLYVTNAHDGSNRLFIVEQPGRIKVLQPGKSTPTVFLDITSKALSGGERGLLGLAFHPQFKSNRRFFVDYTRRTDGATVIAEYRVSAADPNVVDFPEKVLLTIAQPYDNHNGGMVEFGPDGFLYIGMGDGGSANDPGNRAQNTNELLGKILRIDVDVSDGSSKPYVSPPTNPYFGTGTGREEIYAIGLRNPWRFSFDRGTGQIYVGDVGQNAVEEIDIVTLGGNYGWRVLEGSRCANPGSVSCSAPGFVAPVAEYTNTGSSGRCSVIGGYVYRGTKSSLPLGSYVYGDYCSGEIFLLEDKVWNVLLDTTYSIVSFGEDDSGEIYVVGIGGTVHRIHNPDAPSLTPLYFPRLATTEGNSAGSDTSEYTGFAVANLDALDATLTLTAFDTSGAKIAGTNLTNPSTITIKKGVQLPITDAEVFGVGLSGRNPLGWVKLDSTASKIVGFFLMFNSGLSILDGADASSNTMTSFVFPEIEDQGFTQIHVVNPDTRLNTVTFDLLKSDGTARAASVTRTVNSNGAVAEFLTELFPAVSASNSDYLRVSSTNGTVPFEYLGKSAIYVEGLNGLDATAGATTLYCPQYVVGGRDYRTALSIVNLESTSGTITFTFIADDGNQIGTTQQKSISGKGKLYITDQKFFLDAGNIPTQGYVKVTSSGPRLAGSVVFGDPNRSRFSTALPLVSALQKEVIFSQLASDATYFTGIALLNPNSSNVNATLDVYDENGKLVMTKVENIPPGQRKSRLMTEYFPSLSGQNRSKGYIKVTADNSMATFAVFGTHTLSALAAIPPQRIP